MELKKYLWVILRGWWLILPTILISATVALVLGYSQTPIYRSSATFVVSPSASIAQMSDLMRGQDMLSKREGVMSTYVAVVTSKTVLGAVYKEIGLTPSQLDHLNVSSKVIPSTNIIEIAATSDDPLIAKTVIDLTGQKTIEYGKTLYENYDLKPLDAANIPESPSEPRIKQNFITAVILGVVLGIGLAFLLENFRGAQEKIASINIIDDDIGIYNAEYFSRRLGEEMVRARRNHYPLSLALMRIDNLSMLNGPNLDKRADLLRQVAGLTSQYLREEDVMAYLEGDVFSILLPDMTGENARALMEYLQTRVSWTPFETSNGAKATLKSIVGITSYNHNGTSREELIAQAGRALQLAQVSENGKTHLIIPPQHENHNAS